ncbi:MAG TPA: MDR family MFS transporter [Gemmatimonadaceae bacterium]|nr:MDR family MFS transporter [Gemmatimonadaceae bacterium]
MIASRPADHPEPAVRSRIVTAESLTSRDRRITLTGVLLALLLAGLDQTIVATAGPAIQRDLQIAPALYAWLTTAYLVAATVMLPIYGKLSDRFGRKPILLAGVSIFLTGSLLCGIAPDARILIAARGVQGLGAAALFTTTYAVIADLFPPAARGRYMGLVSAVMGLASVIGPLAGGVITDTFGWHWVFFINLPIGAVALWFIIRTMPRLGVHGERRLPVDVAGALLLVAGLVPLMIALSLGRGEADAPDGYPWSSWQIITMLAVAAVGLAAFIARERRAPDPILHLELFRNRVVAFGTSAMFVIGAAFLFGIIFLPLFLVNVVGVSATDAGLAMMPLTLGIVVSSVAAGQLVSLVGHAKLLMLSSLVVLAGAFALLGFTLTPDATQRSVSLLMLLIGLGTGPTLPLYTLVMQAASHPREIGVVTATATFSRLLGQVLGLAFFGTVFASTFAGAVERRVQPELALLAPEVRTSIIGTASRARAGEERVSVAFDSAAARARVRRVAPTDPEALAAVDRAYRGFQLAFTAAITVLFRLGMALVIVAFVITAFMPDVQLRHTNAAPSTVE